MKKLKKILLINWLYFGKELIEVGDVNFLTGKNGAGKSTVIDALQIVLLGETNSRNFNQAANEKSQRTLDGYLRADMDENNPYSRRGKDFSSYIACEFQDEAEGTSFVTGVVFDCRSDGSRQERFFIYMGTLPENCFIENGEAMEIPALRLFLKQNYARAEIYDTQREYRRNMLSRWNVHNEQVLRMLKKAVSFRPIVDIQKFITENICDTPDKPDIEAMQQNIRDYKSQEVFAQRLEEKLAALKKISGLYRAMNQAIERWRVQSFLVQWSQKEKLNREKDGQNTQVGQFKERIRQLDDELLPEQHRQLKAMQDRLAEEFPCEYQENVGIPQYQQEFDRLKRAEAVFKKFSSLVEQSAQEQDAAKDKLFAARREYADRFKFYAFRIEAMDNEEYAAEQRRLEESELPQYHEKIKTAQESALEQFQNDFLAKLKSSIDQVQNQVKNLNRALRHAQFGTDRYQFRVERNPDYAEYYDMIMAPEFMEGDVGLFALPFQNKYGHLIEKLFSQITMADDEQLNARKQSELQENIQRYTDFRTYLKFDLETTDQNGTKQLLSQTLNTKSGGETQTPFYIAVLASFAQLYRVNDTSVFGNTVRLVVFDEAFNKMDSERIVESVRLLRKMGLQAIICTPPDKVADIMPIADCTLLVNKDKYQMHILTFGKEIA